MEFLLASSSLRDTKPLDHGHAPPMKGKSPPTPAGIEDLHQNLDTSTAPGRLSLIWTFLLLMQPGVLLLVPVLRLLMNHAL